MNGVEEVVDVAAQAAMYSHDFSLLSLFWQASLTVKGVILLLLCCSFWSWTIIFAKLSHLKNLLEKAERFEEAFWNSGSLDALFENVKNREDDPYASVFVSGMKEWKRAKCKVKSVISGLSLKDRVEKMMRVALGRQLEHLEEHVGFLATVGSTSPFIGLFGTVWGIMNSFESIGIDQNTNLTSVAPGIAEALFATALGLIVTIPAVVAYNKISSLIGKYENRLNSFIEEFSAIVSRQIEDAEV